jgi:hypothetical protein
MCFLCLILIHSCLSVKGHLTPSASLLTVRADNVFFNWETTYLLAKNNRTIHQLPDQQSKFMQTTYEAWHIDSPNIPYPKVLLCRIQFWSACPGYSTHTFLQHMWTQLNDIQSVLLADNAACIVLWCQLCMLQCQIQPVHSLVLFQKSKPMNCIL